MEQKFTYGVIIVVVLGLAYYLVSPLWRITVADDASPLAAQEQLPMPAITTLPVETPNQPRILAQGDFVAKAHGVQGKALLIEHNGKQTLRFENFETIDGPDVHIYLSSDFSNKDIIDLGDIKATKGNVNYDIPAGVDTTKYNKVLVWCVKFHVLFSAAELTPLSDPNTRN